METINPNLKSCMNNLQVIVKCRPTKVVDKSRPSTLISPKVQGAKNKKKQPLKKIKNIITTKIPEIHESASSHVSQELKTTKINIIPNKKRVVSTSKATERIVVQTGLSPKLSEIENMFPNPGIHPSASPFPVIPAGANPVVDPVTKQVFMPAFIPVAPGILPPGPAEVGPSLSYMTPFLPGSLNDSHIERERYENSKRDDRYHSAELDYFLGGNNQYINEMSQRKRSRSFSTQSSSTISHSEKRKRTKYSPDNRRSYHQSRSYRSFEREESPRSGRYSYHSGSRSRSIYGSRHYSQSPVRSIDRSLSPPVSGSCHLKSTSRSPVSDDSFRGSFLTISEATSRDSVREISRERSRSKSYNSDDAFIGKPYNDEQFLEVDPEFDARNYSQDKHSLNSYSRHSHSQERSLLKSSTSSRRHGLHQSSFSQERDTRRDMSLVNRGDRWSNETQNERDTLRNRSPEYERFVEKDEGGERIYYIRRERNHSGSKLQQDDLERVSEFEDVSDFEEISDLEEVSDNNDSINDEEYYEIVSDSEEPVEAERVVHKNVEVEVTPEDDKYDGYLNPSMVKPGNENDLEEISDSEIQVNDNQCPVSETKPPTFSENQTVINASDSATALIKDVLAGISSSNIQQQSEEGPSKITNIQNAGSRDDWNAVSKSTVQEYENLGLLRDVNDRVVYVGQGSSNPLETESSGSFEDESLQGYVKTLWQFPHKGVLHMSYTVFSDESEAYKDELIGEIIHIILGLDLPYVTLNKLRNAIREKIGIQLSSVEELRQILLLYPQHFLLTKHTGSDSEDDDDPEMQTNRIRVSLKIVVRLCERHRALPFSQNVCTCDALHICPFYLLSNCKRLKCALGHDLKTEHNANVIIKQRLHRAKLAELIEYLRNVDHRSIDTVPSVCKFYNRRRGCAKESDEDDDELCFDMHVCYFHAMDSCRKGEECERSHSIMTGQPLIVLHKYGLDPHKLGEFNILSIVRLNLRKRRQELEMLNEKLAEKSLTEKEVKLCIARGINPKLLQMTKALKGHPLVTNTIQDTDKGKLDNLNVSGKTLVSAVGADELNTTKPQTTLSLQMQAQKVLIDKALYSLDKVNDSSSVNPADPTAVIPLICKFYNNEAGCARISEVCEFIHVCHHYVMGDCKYHGRCKRSHDLINGQPENILRRLGLVNMSENEIIEVLRKLCGQSLVGIDNEPGTL